MGFNVDVPAGLQRPGTRAVGVDLGISTFAALSDGGFIPSLKAARRAERLLQKANRALARTARGSRGRRKARLAVGRCHAKTARARLDYLHQAGARLVRDYDAIAVEKLNVKGLARSALAKDVHDASWAKLLGERLHNCSRCGLVIDRDLNAARNILDRAGVGLGLLNVADCGMRAGANLVGDGVRDCARTYESLH